MVRLWDCRKKRCVHALKNHSGQITDLKIAGNKRNLVVGSKDGSLKMWDLSSNRTPETISSSEPISQVDVTGNCVISMHALGVIKVWSAVTFELMTTVQTIEGRCFETEGAEGKMFVAGRKSLQVYKTDGTQTCDYHVKWCPPLLCTDISQLYCVCSDPHQALSLWGINKSLLSTEEPQGFAWEQIVPEKVD